MTFLRFLARFLETLRIKVETDFALIYDGSGPEPGKATCSYLKLPRALPAIRQMKHLNCGHRGHLRTILAIRMLISGVSIWAQLSRSTPAFLNFSAATASVRLMLS